MQTNERTITIPAGGNAVELLPANASRSYLLLSNTGLSAATVGDIAVTPGNGLITIDPTGEVRFGTVPLVQPPDPLDIIADAGGGRLLTQGPAPTGAIFAASVDGTTIVASEG